LGGSVRFLVDGGHDQDPEYRAMHAL
jgi:hypothetical protein